jgi:hypothetical protein
VTGGQPTIVPPRERGQATEGLVERLQILQRHRSRQRHRHLYPSNGFGLMHLSPNLWLGADANAPGYEHVGFLCLYADKKFRRPTVGINRKVLRMRRSQTGFDRFKVLLAQGGPGIMRR